MNYKYYKSLTIGIIALFSISCSYIDYVSNDSINISITDSTLNGREIRKGDPIKFELYSASIDPDFPCYQLKRELFIDEKKVEIPGDTGNFKNSLKVTISTSDLEAGAHTLRIRVNGCNDLDKTEIIKFTILEGAPPIAKITKTRLIAEPGKAGKLQVNIHFSSSVRQVKSIILTDYGKEGSMDDKALDTLTNINKFEGDTSFLINLYYEKMYTLVLNTSDGVSNANTDTLTYNYQYTAIYNQVITSDTRWSLNNSPYLLYGTLEIKGAKFIIDPGVVVRMGLDSKIIVNPDASTMFIAEGTSDNPIYFSRQYIKCNGFEINSNATFKYCIIGQGMRLYVNNNSLAFENCKADSIVLDKTSNFNLCNNNQIGYLSINASQFASIGVNNTIIKQDVTNKK